MAPKVDIDSTPKDHSLETFIKGQCITLPKISFQCILKLYFSNKDLLVIRKKLLVHSISSIFIKTTFQLDFKKDTVKNWKKYNCDFEKVTKWFYENYMVSNQGKCHFMRLGRNTKNKTFVFKNKIMRNSVKQKILGIIIDNKLHFKKSC